MVRVDRALWRVACHRAAHIDLTGACQDLRAARRPGACPGRQAARNRIDPNGFLIGSTVPPSRALTRFPSTVRVGKDRSRRPRGQPAEPDPTTMLDIVFIAGSLAFFALTAGYTALCERL